MFRHSHNYFSWKQVGSFKQSTAAISEIVTIMANWEFHTCQTLSQCSISFNAQTPFHDVSRILSLHMRKWNSERLGQISRQIIISFNNNVFRFLFFLVDERNKELCEVKQQYQPTIMFAHSASNIPTMYIFPPLYLSLLRFYSFSKAQSKCHILPNLLV